MMSVIRSAALLLVLVATTIVAQDCRVAFQQQKRTSWSNGGASFTLYDALIHNTGSSSVNSLTVSSSDSFTGFWELNSIGGNKYTLPEWRGLVGGIAAGDFHQFGYIIEGSSPAEFTVVSCDGAEPDPADPTAAPTPCPTPATEAPTDAPTEAPTDAPTEAPTDAPTEAPTEEPTEAPTDAPTDAPTERPTDAPTQSGGGGHHTQKPTKAPTTKPTRPPTDAPTDSPTSAPTPRPTRAPTTKAPTDAPTTKAPTTKAPTTKAPTDAPTTKAPTTKAPTTKAPTDAPTTKAPTTKAPTSAPTTKAPTTKAPTSAPTTGGGGSNGGRVCPAGSWWAPKPQTTWQWQITGKVDTSIDVQMYDIDLFSATTSIINTLHGAGRAVVCYFSTQYEDWRPDAKDFTSAVIGNALDDWDGENYVDIRSSVVRKIMEGRLDLAVSKGCDGVEPDNVDGYSANTGFPLKAADQIDYNTFLAAAAHQRGLSIGLKNDLSQAKTLEPSFDWALNEQCYEYSECDDLKPFIDAGKAVFNTEYEGTASKVCPYMVGIKFSALIKNLDLDASIKAECCTYQSNGCADVAWSCTSSTNGAAAMITEESLQNDNTQQPAKVVSAASSSSFYSATLVLATIIFGLLVVA